MHSEFWFWRHNIQRRLNIITLVLYLFGLFGPQVLALATPQIISRPGAGVSRMPLDVMQFNAPGFGQLEQAINVANGNLLVLGANLSRNNLRTSGTDETFDLFGGEWLLSQRVRLGGFDRIAISSTANAPSTLTVFTGDGSSQSFSRITTGWTVAPLSTAPSWIKRYQNAGSNIVVYRNQVRLGTQYADEYLVLVINNTGTTKAFYYMRDGSRYGFLWQGQYPDEMQTLDQQYRSAQASDPNTFNWIRGMTEFWTSPSGSGRIAKIRNEYERGVFYKFNGTLLEEIYFTDDWYTGAPTAQQFVDAKTNARRMIQFTYGTTGSPAISVISSVRFVAPSEGVSSWNMNTLANTTSRLFEFEYIQANGRVLMQRMREPVVGGKVEYRYTYDSSSRLTRLDTRTINGSGTDLGDRVPPTTYDYRTVSGTPTNVTVDNPIAMQGPPLNLPKTLAEGNGGSVMVLYGADETARYTTPANLTPGVYEVRLRARGFNYQGWPAVALRQDGGTSNTSNVGSAVIDSATYVTKSLGQVFVSPSSNLDVAFTNDACCGPSGGGLSNDDRNVIVDDLTLVPVGTTGASTVVTMTQGTSLTATNRKQTEFHYNTSGQLVRKRVRDFNPYIASTQWLRDSGLTPERWLEWQYSYETTGNTDVVTTPTGARTEYDYDPKGNLSELRTYVAGAGAGTANAERRTTMAWDDDNQLTTQTVIGTGGTANRGGVNFNYSNIETRNVYTYHPTVTASTQTFRQVSQISTELRVGATLHRTTQSNFDTNGRLTSVTRSGQTVNGLAVPSRTTTFTYWDTWTTWQPFVPTASSGVSDTSRATAARQHGDLIRTINNGEFTQEFHYDWWDNIHRTVQTNVYTSNWGSGTAGTQTRSSRATITAYDGFGNSYWGLTYNPSNYAEEFAKSRSSYSSSGEISSSWSGNSSNTTSYGYQSSGVSLGRLATVTSPNASQSLSYDDFGRVSVQAKDGFNHQYQYDTLDRKVRQETPDTSTIGHTYHSSGGLAFTDDQPTATRGPGVLASENRYDSLGRIIEVAYDAYNWGGTRRQSTLQNTYDIFDQLIKQVDNRIEMNPAGDSRASVMVYDSLGNLVKKAGPELRGTALDLSASGQGSYSDGRRTYVEYLYDAYDRRREQRTQLSGGTAFLGGNLTMPSGVSTAVTQMTYDAYGRITNTTDPEGYTAVLAYDPAGNLVEKREQMCKSGDTACTAMASGLDASNRVISRFAFDGMNRDVRSWSPRSVNEPSTVQPYIKTYNLLGNVLALTNERGITTHAYRYRDDGLVDEIAEPITTDGTTVSGVQIYSGTTPPSGYVVARKFSYANGRKFVSKECEPVRNSTDASAGSATASTASCKDYTIDWAGRVLTMTLPADAQNNRGVMTYEYDGRGNQKFVRDSFGLETEFTHDSWGRVVLKLEKARSGNAADTAAGLGTGLQTASTYDLLGNLREEVKGTGTSAIRTEYHYNSMGKVIAESRPHRVGNLNNFKLHTYTLGGAKTAQTSYDYQGNLASLATSVNAGNATGLTVTAGNVTLSSHDLRSRETREISRAPTRVEHDATNSYNGFGFRFQRVFTGDAAVYAEQRDLSGTAQTNPNYNSYWQYDANGKLLESFDLLPGQSTATVSLRQNRYVYTYSPTNQELTRQHTVLAVTQMAPVPGLNLTTRSIGIGGASGSVTNTYNERDDLQQVAITDSLPITGGTTTNRTSTFTHYLDGNLQRSTATHSGAFREFTYDGRGRTINVADSNGGLQSQEDAYNFPTPQTIIAGTTSTVTQFGSDGTVTNEVRNNANACVYRTTTVQSVGDLVATRTEWPRLNSSNQPNNCATSVQTSFTYNSAGQQTGLTEGAATATFTYDNFGNRTVESTVVGGTTVATATSTYNAMNGLTSVQRTAQGLPTYTATYTLDSRGNRLGVSDTRGDTNLTVNGNFNSYQKRYNAEGRDVLFFRFGRTGTFNTEPYVEDNATIFRWDPYGRQVLSATAVYRNLYNSPFLQTALELGTKVYTNLGANGQVQLTRKQSVFGAQLFGVGEFQRDEAYSMADGILENDWSAIRPFSVAKPVSSLSAPTTPFSQSLRLSIGNIGVLDIAPPNQNATPPQSSPTVGPVVPPAAQSPASSNGQPSSNSGGVSGFSLNPSGNTLSPSGSVLPPSVQGTTSSQVTAPTNVTPPTTPNPGQVTTPAAPTPPSVGTSPSQGPATVAPPTSSGLLPPTIPNVGAGSSPVGTTLPPIGWQPTGDVGTQLQALSYAVYIDPGDYTTPSNNDNAESGNQTSQSEVTGSDPNETQNNSNGGTTQAAVDNNLPEGSGAAGNDLSGNGVPNPSTPTTNETVTNGTQHQVVNGDDLKVGSGYSNNNNLGNTQPTNTPTADTNTPTPTPDTNPGGDDLDPNTGKPVGSPPDPRPETPTAGSPVVPVSDTPSAPVDCGQTICARAPSDPSSGSGGDPVAQGPIALPPPGSVPPQIYPLYVLVGLISYVCFASGVCTPAEQYPTPQAPQLPVKPGGIAPSPVQPKPQITVPSPELCVNSLICKSETPGTQPPSAAQPGATPAPQRPVVTPAQGSNDDERNRGSANPVNSRKQIDRVAKELGLDKEERRELHDAITKGQHGEDGKELSIERIRQIGREMFPDGGSLR